MSAPTAEKPIESDRFQLRPRRSVYLEAKPKALPDADFYSDLDCAYRALCAVLFNFVPLSGHPGGSVSSGRIVSGLLFKRMDYDFSSPDAPDADLICYAGGHKGMGLYAMWALRDELMRVAKPALLPKTHRRLRLEDLLGFRRNPTQNTPLFKKFKSKALDGHPTPLVPFVPIATGPSGVGVTNAVGLALGARDAYGPQAPRVHIIEGEGGLTPGRVHEALAAAASTGLSNIIMHVDWNQSSIDSDQVTAEGITPGDYVQWDPMELMRVHDWNVVYAGDGHDLETVHAAQELAMGLDNGQPTTVVYRTVKGWRYGIEGKKSHGAGHKFASEGYYKALGSFEERFNVVLPRIPEGPDAVGIEKSYFDTLTVMREALDARPGLADGAAQRVEESRRRLKGRARAPRKGGPDMGRLAKASLAPGKPPAELRFAPGSKATLRDALGDSLAVLNRASNGALLVCAADLLGSTSVVKAGKDFPDGFYHAAKNPGSRLVSAGGICEDAMGGIMAGVSGFGQHIGVTSSYSAFIAPLEHIPARAHAISQQFRHAMTGDPKRTWIMINAHAGSMTGEDGPTHADPQPLQLLQGNFPAGSLISLTPWEPSELWPLVVAGLKAAPAVLAPFVTRPAVQVPDRKALGLPPAEAAAKGVYAMRRAKTNRTVVIQGCGSAVTFVENVLPKLDEEGVKLNVFYVASAELFDLLPKAKRENIFPDELMRHAMGITDFTLPTMHRWIRSAEGVNATLHPFRKGEYLGSGMWTKVLEEAGLDGPSQLKAVKAWARGR